MYANLYIYQFCLVNILLQFQTNLMEYRPQWGEFYPPDLILHGEIERIQMLYKLSGEQEHCQLP